MRLAVSLSLLISSTAFAGPEQDYVNAVSHMSSGKYEEAKGSYARLLEQKAIPDWVRLAGEADLAYACLATKDTRCGFEHLERAIALGFNDFELLRTDPVYSAYRADPKLQELYGKIRISDADKLELEWLRREAELVAADTQALIQESRSRADLGLTEIFQSRLPTRTFQSAWVGVSRQILSLMQQMSRSAVLEADRRRLLETGTRIYSSTEVVVASMEAVGAREKARRDAILARKLDVPTSASTQLQPPPPY